jgi:hypothetical protein
VWLLSRFETSAITAVVASRRERKMRITFDRDSDPTYLAPIPQHTGDVPVSFRQFPPPTFLASDHASDVYDGSAPSCMTGIAASRGVFYTLVATPRAGRS